MGVNKTPSLHLRPYHFPEFLQNDSSHTLLVRSTCLVLLIHHHILWLFGTTLYLALPLCPDFHLLPLTASQYSDSPVPTFLVPVDLSMCTIFTLVIVAHHQPILIHLKDHSFFPSRLQFPISEIYCHDLMLIIIHFLSQGLLIPVDSPCNTPILPMHKLSGAYCLVHDLCVIYEAPITTHPAGNNLYTLLSNIPTTTSHFTILI